MKCGVKTYPFSISSPGAFKFTGAMTPLIILDLRVVIYRLQCSDYTHICYFAFVLSCLGYSQFLRFCYYYYYSGFAPSRTACGSSKQNQTSRADQAGLPVWTEALWRKLCELTIIKTTSVCVRGPQRKI